VIIKRTSILFSALLLTLALATDAAVKPAAQRKPAPVFSAKDSQGRPIALSSFKGKVVLLNFWATYCGPCKLEMPWFVEFEKKYGPQGFAVFGVSMDEEGWEVVKPYLERVPVNYQIGVVSDEVASLYGGVETLPETLILDREGRIAARHIGLVSKSEYEKDIESLLGAGKRPGARK
jgi:thiol-disulfide isomerase/thioredoxin